MRPVIHTVIRTHEMQPPPRRNAESMTCKRPMAARPKSTENSSIATCYAGPRRALLLPISQPQPLSTLTTLGKMAAVSGTRTKMKLLWIAYASASCVARPVDGVSCLRNRGGDREELTSPLLRLSLIRLLHPPPSSLGLLGRRRCRRSRSLDPVLRLLDALATPVFSPPCLGLLWNHLLDIRHHDMFNLRCGPCQQNPPQPNPQNNGNQKSTYQSYQSPPSSPTRNKTENPTRSTPYTPPPPSTRTPATAF